MYSSPKISIIVPIYNVAPYLAACLESLVCQTLVGIEIILINDGSTDGSAAVMASFKARHPHLICLEQPNRGTGAARNAGLKIASGDYICFVDADDYLAVDFCEKIYGAAVAAQADLCYSSVTAYDEQTGKSAVAESGLFSAPVLTGSAKAEVFEHFMAAMGVGGKIAKRELFVQFGILFPVKVVNDDVLVMVTLLARAYRVTAAAQAVYFYRINRPGSTTSRREKTFPDLFFELEQGRSYLQQSGSYELFAPQFEYLRFVCILSFIFTYGLNETNWKLLKENKQSVLSVSSRLFKGRGVNFRLKFVTLKASLRYGMNSYPVLVRRAKKYIYNPLKKFFGQSGHVVMF